MASAVPIHPPHRGVLAARTAVQSGVLDEAETFKTHPPRVLPSSALGRDGLQDLEALKLRVAEMERLVAAGPLVRGAKGRRSRPGLEICLAAPDGMRGVKRVVLVLRSPQQVELMNPGTASKWTSRWSQTASKSLSEPGFTWKRFIAMNMACSLPPAPI
jgi:hypothetical protein